MNTGRGWEALRQQNLQQGAGFDVSTATIWGHSRCHEQQKYRISRLPSAAAESGAAVILGLVGACVCCCHDCMHGPRKIVCIALVCLNPA
jgi:hypothetical protein